MEFGILGPLQLTRHGAPVPLPGRILPRLLAVLLLEAGHVVTLDRIIDAVWEDQPPNAARRRVQNTVSEARRLLHHDGAPRLDAVGQGYRLHLDPDHLDALRFRTTVRAAREQRADDPEAALTRLRDALALWRGPALAGLTGRVIDTGARRWNEERAAAEEDRAELELALRTSAPVVADLRAVLDEHPYRQRAAELLMIALHRDDRVPEALNVYEDMRRRLDDDLGIDPVPRLRDLHTAILREDPALTPPARPATAPEPDRRPHKPPAQLPADSVHFTGRTKELAALDTLLEPGPAAAVLSGIGGSGKTALAVHWGHRVRDHFADGQLYVDLRGFDRAPPVPPLDALAGFLRALGVPPESIPSDVDQAAALYRTRLADTRTLVILDNARDSTQVRPLLPATSGCAAVITSRFRLRELATAHDVVQLPIGALDAGESVTLLGNLVGRTRLDHEPDEALRIADLCAGLPLALRIVGTNLAAQTELSLADTADELSGTDRLDRLAVEGDPTTTVAAAFDLSYQALLPDEELLYLTLAILPGDDCSEALATALARWEPTAAKRILARLVAAHRIEHYRPGRYRFHDLLREYARRKAEEAFSPTAIQRLREQVVDWYAQGDTQLPVREYRNIVTTFLAWRGHPTVSRLLERLIPFADAAYREEPADARYELPELAQIAEAGIETAHRTDDPTDLAWAYALADAVAYASGDLDKSMTYGQKVVGALRRTEHGDRTGRFRSNLGTTLTQLGRYREAVSLLREAVAASARHGSIGVQVECLTSLASVLRRMGIYAEAESLVIRAKTLDAGQDGGPTSVYTLLTMSELYLDMGRVAEADDACRDIARMLTGHPSKYYRARLAFRQAGVATAEGDTERAEASLKHGLRLVEDVSGWRHLVVYSCQLAKLYLDTGRPDDARTAVERAAGFKRYQTSETLALQARLLCRLHSHDGDHRRAVNLGRQAADVFGAMPDPLRQARSLEVLAEAYDAQGDTESAGRCRYEAAAILYRLRLGPSPE